MTTAISVRHLTHRFGSRTVLDDVSFEVAQGEIYGFIGPNGAGKTTTIRILASLLEPLAGEVLVGGFDVVTQPEQVRRQIGYMPDHAGVYEGVTVREYLEFFALANGVTDPAIVHASLELTELTSIAERLVGTLSKGMRQRLQLARILLPDPAVLILDEPASDLDPRARIELRRLLLDLRELNKTILLSSHILTELSDICTSVAILEQGRLVHQGPIASLIHAPTSSVAEGPRANRRLRLRLLADPHSVLPLIRGLIGVLEAEPGPLGSVLVTHQGDDAWIASLVAHLVGAGLGVIGVEPENDALESLFMQVTRGELS